MSFSPSPTISTLCPSAASAATAAALSCGVIPARQSSIPSSSAMAPAAPAASPESIITPSPCLRSDAMVAAAPGRRLSAKSIRHTRSPIRSQLAAPWASSPLPAQSARPSRTVSPFQRASTP